MGTRRPDRRLALISDRKNSPHNRMSARLLTTTALVAAGVAGLSAAAQADRPKLTIGGFTEQIFGVGANDDAFDGATGQRTGIDQHSDGEIHFSGSVTLDNGIKIRTRVELEANSVVDKTAGAETNIANGAPGSTGDGDQIDEHWMRISGAFGEVRLGSGDPAAMAMTTGYLGTWATNVGINQAFNTSDWVTNPGLAAGFGDDTVARLDVSSDAEHISYFTPRYAGLQVGMSYIPSRTEDQQHRRELVATNDHDGWSFGVNFDRRYGDLGIGIAGGYAIISESTPNLGDRTYWGGAVRIDYAGFRIAASRVTREDPGTALVPTGFGQTAYEAGIRYTFGANAVSLSHFHGRTESRSAGLDDDVVNSTFVAYRRTLGPGVYWRLTAIFAEYDDGLATSGPAVSNSGEALVTSVFVRF